MSKKRSSCRGDEDEQARKKSREENVEDKMLSYRWETALQGCVIVFAKSMTGTGRQCFMDIIGLSS